MGVSRQPCIHKCHICALGEDIITIIAGVQSEPPVRPDLSDPLFPEDPALFAVCGRERVVIITHRLIRALPAVAHPGHLPLHPGESGDVVGEVPALQLPADETDGDDDPLPEFLVPLLGKSDCLDKTGKAGDGVAPRNLEHLLDNPRHLHWVVGRAGPGADLLCSIENPEGKKPLRVVGGGDADDMVNDALGEQRLQEPGRHPARSAGRPVSLRVADVGGKVVAGLGTVLDARNPPVEPLRDGVLVLSGIGERADFCAEAALRGAGYHLDRVVLPVAVPLHRKDILRAESGAEAAADAEVVLDNAVHDG